MRTLYCVATIDTSKVPEDQLDNQKQLLINSCRSELRHDAAKEGIAEYTIAVSSAWSLQTNYSSPTIECIVTLTEVDPESK